MSNGKLYTGYTTSLKVRLGDHRRGKVRTTSRHLPVKLLHYEVYQEKSDALRREKYLKTTEGKRFLRMQLRDVLKLSENALEGSHSGLVRWS